MSRTGIFGGTFNPVHNGHIHLAQYCMDSVSLDRIIIIPDSTPPHKSDKLLADSAHRLKMCELAVSKLANFDVSDIEIKRGGKSYTYQTLTELSEQYPDDELFFITGADMFLTLDKWVNPEVIFSKAAIIAVPRDSEDFEALNNYYNKVLLPLDTKAIILSEPVECISSTYIRDNINDKQVVSKYLNSEVYEYIVQNNLYGV